MVCSIPVLRETARFTIFEQRAAVLFGEETWVCLLEAQVKHYSTAIEKEEDASVGRRTRLQRDCEVAFFHKQKYEHTTCHRFRRYTAAVVIILS